MGAAENKQLMQKIFEGVAKGDRTMFIEHLADDVTMTVTGENSWSRTHRGKENIRRDLWGYVNSLVAEGRKTIAFHFLADGDWVMVEARGDMVTKAGVPYRNHYCLLYRLENGKIVEMKEYLDSAMCERILGPYPATLNQA